MKQAVNRDKLKAELKDIKFKRKKSAAQQKLMELGQIVEEMKLNKQITENLGKITLR